VYLDRNGKDARMRLIDAATTPFDEFKASLPTGAVVIESAATGQNNLDIISVPVSIKVESIPKLTLAERESSPVSPR